MLFATGLMTRRHMSLEECLSHISKGRAEFCNSLWWPRHKSQRATGRSRVFAEFFHTFSRAGLFTAGLRPWSTTPSCVPAKCPNSRAAAATRRKQVCALQVCALQRTRLGSP